MTVADLTIPFDKYTVFELFSRNGAKLSPIGQYYFSEIPIDIMDKIVCKARVNAYYRIEIVFEA